MPEPLSLRDEIRGVIRDVVVAVEEATVAEAVEAAVCEWLRLRVQQSKDANQREAARLDQVGNPVAAMFWARAAEDDWLLALLGEASTTHPFDPHCVCMVCGERIAAARRAEVGWDGRRFDGLLPSHDQEQPR